VTPEAPICKRTHSLDVGFRRPSGARASLNGEVATMTDYLITCVKRFTTPGEHKHINEVGTATGEARFWTVGMVNDQLEQGDDFYIVVGGYKASVCLYQCEACGFNTIGTVPGSNPRANIDALPACPSAGPFRTPGVGEHAR